MSSKIGERLQVAGNVAIIAGLLLVGVQLGQNSSLLKTQLLYEESQRITDLEVQFVGENAAEVWAKSIENPEDLTLAEQRVMESLLWSFIEQWRSTHMLAELGLLEDGEWRLRVEEETSFLLGNRYAATWWSNFNLGDSSLPGDLVEVVNDALSTGDPKFTPNYFKRIMDSLNENTSGTE